MERVEIDIDLPEECAKQWEMLLLLISAEERKIDRTTENEIDTISYFFKNEGVMRILHQWLNQMQLVYGRKICNTDTPLKCDEVSLYWRQIGNEKFRVGAFEESYKCYTYSVLYAVQGGPMYPLALANRSAALIRMRKFKECLSDISLAIAKGYPVEQQHKLLLRRADCNIEMGYKTEAIEALVAARRHAATLNFPAAQADEFARNMYTMHQKLNAMVERIKPQPDVLPDCYKGVNDNFDSASNVLELRRSDTAGRHVMVTEPTRRGDVMFSEEPYAWVTLATDQPVCEGCCRGPINPIPCSECSRSKYCSEECRVQAAATYHRWECVGAQTDLLPTIGIAHLSLRMLLVTAIKGFPKVPNPDANPTTAAALFQSYLEIDDIEIYKRDSPPFYRMFHLLTNFDKMSNTDYIQYAVTAIMLVLYLENFTSFFEYLPPKLPYNLSTSELRLFAGAVMLRSLGQLVCNGHATISIYSSVDKTGIFTEREVRRATAIYPSAAMMNHSCEPNIISSFYKNRLVVRCLNEMAPNTELFNCYGPQRARDTTHQRRSLLKAQYYFTCSCPACTDTDRGDFVSLFSAYACQTCKGPVLRSGRKARCQQCNVDFSVQYALATVDRADDMLQQGEQSPSMEERVEKVQASYRLKQQALHRHNTSLRATADRLAQLYAESGEFNKSLELIKQNIQSLEYQFGSFSVEVAHELRKMSDVMMERILRCPQSPEYGDWCLEAYKIIKKTVQLMDLNYGSWEVLVKRLREQENFLGTMVADSQAQDVTVGIQRNLHYNLKI